MYSQCSSNAAYIWTNTGPQPWNQPSNIIAMDAAFGAGNWDALFFETLNPASVFTGDQYGTIFIEGSDFGANELTTFLMANLPAIEAFVSAGGSLYLNAAPNEGGNINFGFGGVVLQYQPGVGPFTDCGIITSPTHPVFDGISTTHFNASSFGHAIICPPGMNPTVLTENANTGDDILIEISFGSGTAIFGGLTSVSYTHLTLPTNREV